MPAKGTEEVQFDYRKYTLSSEPEKRTVVVEETGDYFEVTVRPLSWAKRNQLISSSLTWGANGETGFNADTYVRSCLKEMVIDAPWGRTTEAFLLSIDERLGAALEALVPKAFGETEDTVDVDEVKKR